MTDLRPQLTSCATGIGPDGSSYYSPCHSLTISQLSGRRTGSEVRSELKIPALSLSSCNSGKLLSRREKRGSQRLRMACLANMGALEIMSVKSLPNN